MRGSGLTRWAPLTGLMSVAFWIAALVVQGGGIDTTKSDAEILAYYADDGNRTKEILTFFLILGASMSFIWFLSVLRGRIAGAEGGAGTLTSLAFGSGLVTTGLWVVAAGLWAVVADTLQETDRFVLDPNSYRLVGGLGYMIFVAGVTISLVLVASTSVIALRTGLLPKWFAWLGIAVAVLLTMSWTFVPFFLLLGWVAVVSVILVLGSEPLLTRPAPNPT
jgi:hypothetical protein